MLKEGTIIDGKYKILEKIGSGGMSVVYLARNERANKTWAIKEVRKDGKQDFMTVKQGLLAETNILKELSHEYLPSIIDVIEDNEVYLIVMDYIEGKALNEVLRENMEETGLPIGIENVLKWGSQLCDVFHYLHTREKPIVYRDLKPSNIMLKPKGDITLIDFGTAREFKENNSQDTTSLGTPGYAAPEQYASQGHNGKASPQSDIYSLGATLHHLVTGRNPAATPFMFPPITQCRPTLLEETPREYRNALLGLESILTKCTQHDPQQRYENCAQLAYDLEHAEELCLPHRRKLKQKAAVFFACAGMAVLLGTVSLTGRGLARQAEKSGYAYYIKEAPTSDLKSQFAMYKKAIALDPQREEAWIGITDAVNKDENGFTTEEESFITKLLTSRDNGRTQDNKTLFQKNTAGYIHFAYEMGNLYYYSKGSAQNKMIAGGWFDVVNKADLSKLDLGDNNEKKTVWQTRSRILGKMSEYNSKIGVTNEAGDAEVTYMDYWNDMSSLMADDIAGKDNAVTELRLYKDIVYQICTHYDAFRDDGVTKEEMEEMLTKIKKAVQEVQSSKSQVQQLCQEILETEAVAEKQVQAAFAANAVKGAAEKTTPVGGGES